MYQYVTEKRYDLPTVDLFLYAFLQIFNTKVVVIYADREKKTVIGAGLTKTIHFFKCQDHFDLFERRSSKTMTSFGECKKSTTCENTH